MHLLLCHLFQYWRMMPHTCILLPEAHSHHALSPPPLSFSSIQRLPDNQPPAAPCTISSQIREGQPLTLQPSLQVLPKKGIQPYVPNFKRAFEHFIIHTGGRAVIDEIEKQLGLTPYLVQPSRNTLRRYGNTSSSSIWCSASAYLMCCSCGLSRCQQWRQLHLLSDPGAVSKCCM